MTHSLNILVVEDDPADCRLIQRQLRQAGFAKAPVLVDNEKDFLIELGGEPDVILCDYNLPQFDAFRALELMQARLLEIPFLIVSGSIGEENAVEALRRGAADFLIKDRLARLGPAIRQACEQRRLRQVARDTVKSLRALADSMPQLVWTADGAGHLTYFNQRYLDYTGLATECLLGAGWQATIHPADLPDSLTRWQVALQTGQGQEAHVRIRNAAGEYRCHLDRQVAQRDETAAIVGWFGTSTDLHDHILTEEALRQERDRFVSIVAVAPGLIHSYRLRPDGTACFTYASEVSKELLGLTADQLRGGDSSAERFVHPGDLAHLRQTMFDSARRLSTWQAEFRYLHPERGERWLETRCNPVRESDGGTLWHGMMTDVTERKEVEEGLKRNETKFRALFEQATDIIVLYDDGKLVEVNRQTSESTGYSSEELLKMSVLDLNPDLTAEGLAAERAALERGRILTVEGRLRRRDGSFFPVEMRIGLIRLEGVSLTLAFARDLTARQLLQERSRQSQRMEAFGQLASGIAHDFNNLLTIISGVTHLVVEDLPQDCEARADLESVLAASDRAADLTAQLLSFSRQSVVETKVLDLNQVLSKTFKMLRRLIGEDIRLESELDPALKLVRADLGQMEQILMNLAVNARDAMPSGGIILFATANVRDTVQLSVSDSGCGMPPEVQARIFEPFFTTKEVGKGTGLGLATVYGIVQDYGGSVEVTSRPGQGTTFKISFPAARTEAHPPESIRAEHTGGQETLLVVEDEDAVRALIKKTLEKQGYRVLSASSGHQALEVALICDRPIDLLVTDVVMPGMDGRSVAESLLGLHPEMRVLYISGYMDDALLRRGVADGRDQFLGKPFSVEALCRKVRAVLDAMTPT